MATVNMKNNKEMGFAPVYGNGNGYGEDRSVVNEDAGGALSMHTEIGQKNGKYRIYAYIWRNNRDASREGVHADLAVRGESAAGAISSFRVRALAAGWLREGVEATFTELTEMCAGE